MPPIASVVCQDDAFIVAEPNGITRLFSTALIPIGHTSISDVETYINTTWVPVNLGNYQMQVHVFQLNPLRVTVCVADLGVTIPAGWWQVG